MLTIKHLTGPLQSTETTLDPNVERVVFGRQLDCDIAYPAEATLVSRHHFALVRKASGDWTIDLFGDPFVAIDGASAEQGQVVHDGARIELGRHGGPSFKTLIATDSARDNYASTERQDKFDDARVLASRARASASIARVAGLAALIVAVAAGGFAISRSFLDHSSVARLDEAMQKFAAAQKDAAETSIGSAVRDQLSRSVYRVIKQNTKNGGLSGVGTAWPVGPHLLATNAHVAVEAEELGADTEMVVRAPGADGKLYVVTGHRIHPGYAAFTAFRAKDPIGMKNAAGQAVGADLIIPGYDVALLEIRETLPDAQIFKLATPAQYKGLRPGQPIATAGYPAEEIVSDKATLIRATPEFHLGTVTGLTNFFFLPADDDHRQLIHDDLPTAGGASGSPIVDNTGRVVALLNAGNMFSMPEMKGMPSRMPSAALVNYAQRVDMLQDLLNHSEDKALEQDRVYWTEQVAYFKRGIDLLVPEIVSEAKPKPDSVATVIFDREQKLTSNEKQANKSGGVQRAAATPLAISKGAYVFVAYGYERSQLELYLMIDDKIVDSAKGSWFPSLKYRTDASGGDKRAEEWFASLKSSDNGDVQVRLWVVSPSDKDVSYVLRAYKFDAKAPSG